jgi:hypothetical protein
MGASYENEMQQYQVQATQTTVFILTTQSISVTEADPFS